MKRSTPPALAHLARALNELEHAGLRRFRLPAESGEVVSFCSNDYLGLAARAAPPTSAGSGASRLVSGQRAEHLRLERELSEWLSVDAVLTFTSGYAANVGVVSALAGPGDLIVSDVLNHASIIDGARLSRARVVVVPHLDLDAIRVALRQRTETRAWVVTESYFSMEADGPDLSALRAICDQAGAALVIDEAHALGVFGPDGRGLAAAAGVVPDVLVGTFGKSFGTAGAFVAGCVELADWLWNRARTFVFSTGTSPAVAAATTAALREIRSRPELREAVTRNAHTLRDGLAEAGLPAIGFGHVIPCVVGDPLRAVALASALTRSGVHVQAIRPPSVPPGTARLRFTASALHTSADIARAIAAARAAVTSGV